MNKKILSLLSLALLVGFNLINPVIIHAAVVNEVMTPPASWGTPTGPVLTIIDAGGEASSLTQTDTTVALRNAPNLSFNPGLDALILAGGTDDTVHEAGAFAISSDETTCPDDTPVAITVGPSVSTIVDMTGTIPNPSHNNSSHALFDLSGPSSPYLSVSDNSNIGDVFNHPGGSYATTFGNLDNMYMIANVEVVESAISNAPSGSEASTSESIPSITLTYDDAGCPPVAPSVSNDEVETTIVSPDTASGEVVVAGSSYGASDANGDDLTYSITDGNDEGYFAIDSDSGDISTTRANVPIGTYTMTVLVDDG
ncbi:MAG TPA: cadherin repeat domain-containing protein, partial [Candidatus Saccharibacteria bacterium]|nr:cadherin repeat domain-containing protein [Candidatus Saccharibacteria bacterium]